MKLVIVTQYFAPEMGAPQSRLLELAKGLQARGWEVRIVTAMPNYPTGKIFPGYKGKLRMKDEVQGIPVYRLWLYPSNSRKTLPRIASMLSFSFTALFSRGFIRKFKPDYVLVESPPLTLVWTVMLVARSVKAKLIMNVSDIWPLSALELGAISKGRVYHQLEKLERYLYRKSDVCLGQSQEIVDHLIANGARNPFLFRNGVDPSRFNPPAQVDQSGKLRLVYAGLLGVAQNVLQICQEVDFAAKNLEFHVYGNGAQGEEIEAYVKANPNKGIVLHGSVNRSEIEKLLPAFHGTIIPLTRGIYGAVPSKIYEAMAAGLPILFSGGGEGEKIIKQHNLGWTAEPGDMKTLNANLDAFAANAANRDKVRNNCIQAARQVFDRNIQIDNLNAFLLQHKR